MADIRICGDFVAKSILKNNGEVTEIFPELKPIEGLAGVSTTGIFVVNNDQVKGDFIFRRTNAFTDKKGFTKGIGDMVLTLKLRNGKKAEIFVQYKTLTSPDGVLLETPGQITAATINNKPYRGTIKFKPAPQSTFIKLKLFKIKPCQ